MTTKAKPVKPRARKKVRYYELNAPELFDYLGLDHRYMQDIQFHAPLSKKQEMFLNDQENDIIVFGGQAASGKSQVSILRMLIGVLSDPHYCTCPLQLNL